ncbi:MAG: DUF7448 domain-containing protein [Waterburya sp.]
MFCEFSELVGKTILSIERNADNDELIFNCNDGSVYKMYHEQDCCENATIESMVGDLNDVCNTPILRAEEVSNDDPDAEQSATWTFYKLATIKGYLDVRWYIESNGYYSESVDFVKLK